MRSRRTLPSRADARSANCRGLIIDEDAAAARRLRHPIDQLQRRIIAHVGAHRSRYPGSLGRGALALLVSLCGARAQASDHDGCTRPGQAPSPPARLSLSLSLEPEDTPRRFAVSARTAAGGASGWDWDGVPRCPAGGSTPSSSRVRRRGSGPRLSKPTYPRSSCRFAPAPSFASSLKSSCLLPYR